MMEDLVGSSGLAPRNYEDQEETSNLMATNLEPTEWTDEKHLLYLKHMETTFVNQLYKSIDVFGLHSLNNCTSGSKSSKQKEHSIGSPCGQFKVFRDGCWSKVDVKREEHEAGQDEESGVLLANPWIQHYRCSERKGIINSPSHQEKSPFAHLAARDNLYPAHHHQVGCQDFVGSTTEVTDQNFIDEDLEEERTGRLHDTKRLKTSTDATYSDQVVPLR